MPALPQYRFLSVAQSSLIAKISQNLSQIALNLLKYKIHNFQESSFQNSKVLSCLFYLLREDNLKKEIICQNVTFF